jgi:hypothetical protein
MNAHWTVVRALETALADEPGWSRPAPHHFRHVTADVDIFVYARDAVIAFDSNERDRLETKAIGCKTTFFPAVAANTVLQVARALVAVRKGHRDGS